MGPRRCSCTHFCLLSKLEHEGPVHRLWDRGRDIRPSVYQILRGPVVREHQLRSLPRRHVRHATSAGDVNRARVDGVGRVPPRPLRGPGEEVDATRVPRTLATAADIELPLAVAQDVVVATRVAPDERVPAENSAQGQRCVQSVVGGGSRQGVLSVHPEVRDIRAELKGRGEGYSLAVPNSVRVRLGPGRAFLKPYRHLGLRVRIIPVCCERHAH